MNDVDHGGISHYVYSRKECGPTGAHPNSDMERWPVILITHTTVFFVLELSLVWSYRPFVAGEL